MRNVRKLVAITGLGPEFSETRPGVQRIWPPLRRPARHAGGPPKIFREAYNKAMKDPALLIEAKHTPLEINPTTGQELDASAKEVVSQPQDVVERMKKLMGR